MLEWRDGRKASVGPMEGEVIHWHAMSRVVDGGLEWEITNAAPGRFNLRVNDEWLGPRATLDEAKALANRLQDVLDGRDPVAELLAKIETALEAADATVALEPRGPNWGDGTYMAGVYAYREAVCRAIAPLLWQPCPGTGCVGGLVTYYDRDIEAERSVACTQCNGSGSFRVPQSEGGWENYVRCMVCGGRPNVTCTCPKGKK